MSSVAPTDTLLLSPLADSFSLYSSSASPSGSGSSVPAANMLKSLPTPDNSNQQQPCLPTHQVFSFSEQSQSLIPPTSPAFSECIPISMNLAGTKRPADAIPILAKKPRVSGERVCSKDFIPPDVSGLSKREARLVKNRAAAFLSRQRKREEFETMELRVAELERENARLLAMVEMSKNSNQDLLSEIQNLQSQLAAKMERDGSPSEKILSRAGTPLPVNLPAIKVEDSQEELLRLPTPPRSSVPLKSGASFGLMVLLCALPTLLSMPLRTAFPTSFSIPNPPLSVPSTAFDINSLVSHDCDWTLGGLNTPMDLDDLQPAAEITSSQKLEFSPSGVTELDVESGLAGLDVSFDATPSDDGKIRVRIHPSSSASSRSTSPGPSSLAESDMSDLDRNSEASVVSLSSLTSLSTTLAQLSHYSPPHPSGDPFLGIGITDDFLKDDVFGLDVPSSDISLSPPPKETEKKRVRIALKSLPSPGGEGGEWEVQVC